MQLTRSSVKVILLFPGALDLASLLKVARLACGITDPACCSKFFIPLKCGLALRKANNLLTFLRLKAAKLVAFVVGDAAFIDHSGNNVRIQGNVLSNKGFEGVFVCLFVIFFQKAGKGEGLQLPVHWTVGADSSVVTVTGFGS